MYGLNAAKFINKFQGLMSALITVRALVLCITYPEKGAHRRVDFEVEVLSISWLK